MRKNKLFISMNLGLIIFGSFIFAYLIYLIYSSISKSDEMLYKLGLFCIIFCFIYFLLMLNKIRFKENSIKVYGSNNGFLIDITLQKSFELEYSNIKGYTLNSPKVLGLEDEKMTVLDLKSMPFIFVSDFDNNLYKISIRRYNKKQVSEIIEELKNRTNIDVIS